MLICHDCIISCKNSLHNIDVDICNSQQATHSDLIVWQASIWAIFFVVILYISKDYFSDNVLWYSLSFVLTLVITSPFNTYLENIKQVRLTQVEKKTKELIEQKHKIQNRFEPIFCQTWDYPPDWDWRRLQIIKRDKCTCKKCNRQLSTSRVPAHVHHIIARSQFEGSHDLNNLTLLCEICHSKMDNVDHSKVKLDRIQRLDKSKKHSIRRKVRSNFSLIKRGIHW